MKTKELKQNRIKMLIYFFVWVVLIIAGIIAKRVYNHAEWMMLFHLPAAVFLVLGFREFSTPLRNRFREEQQNYLHSEVKNY